MTLRKYKPQNIFVVVILFLLLISYILSLNFEGTFFNYLNYTDELITILFGGGIFYFLFFKKAKLSKASLGSIVCFILMTLIGLFSNMFSNLLNNYFAIAIDFIALAKVFFPFIFISLIKPDKDEILNMIQGFAKIFIIVSFFFSILNVFFDIGMSRDFRYGLRSFCFIFKNEARFGLVISFFLLSILETEKKKNVVIFFSIITLVQLLLTTKSLMFIVVLVAIFHYFLSTIVSSKNMIVYYGILALVVLIIAYRPIVNYLLDDTAPRSLFLRYGLVTANDYFPLGSGFGTFGSDVAADYYSQLYYKYGFDKIYGMAPNYQLFLNDVFLGMLIGQYGYLGVVLFYIAFAVWMLSFLNSKFKNKFSSSMVFGLVFMLCACTVATAIIKSSIGMFTLIGLTSICLTSVNHEKKC